jgi:fructose-1-phosphate kinase PfkB-like protein
MIENCEIVVFSGTSSCVETDFIFPAGIEYANKFDKISICDTYGSHLKDCIDRSPTIIHNNINEIESSLNISLNSEKDKIDFLDFLYSKEIKQSYLTDGGSPLFAANFDYHYAAGLPVVETVDSTGSGDSFVAGIVYAWYNDLTFEEGIILASALGAVNAASSETCTVKLQDIQKLKSLVRISPIGKKMKTLDVTSI